MTDSVHEHPTRPDLKRFLSIVEREFDDSIVDTLCRYTAIACVSPVFDAKWREHGEIHRATNLLAKWCEERHVRGATVEIVEIEGRTPLIFAEVPPTGSGRADTTTLIYGHLDKQPALGEWRAGLEPFRAVREGDRLYGRGTADDGYATFAAFTALSALDETDSGHDRIVVIIEASEESGSPDLEAYVEHLAPRIGNIGLVICLDSGCATYDRLWLTTSLRGVVNGELRVDVLTEGVHSGHAGGIVPSSFRICRELLSRLEDQRSGEVLVAALRAEIPEHRRQEIATIAAEFGDDVAGVFPVVPGLELAGTSLAERIEGGTWQPALEVIGADGLPAVATAGNVLRPSTTLKLSMRIPPTCDPKAGAESIRQTLCADPPHGASVRFVIEQTAPGWEAPPLDSKLHQALERASMTLFGASVRSMGVGGSIPFMSTLGKRFPHAQFLATGVLGPESNAHGPNEFLHLPTAKALTATVASVLARTT